MESKIKFVILAAGRGTRMKSERPKALMQVGGKLMPHHLRDTLAKIHSAKPVLVVGYKAEEVKSELGDAFDYAIQEEQLGTAHAVASAKGELRGAEHVMVFYGDNPFIKDISVKKIIDTHLEKNATVTFATTRAPHFEGEFSSFASFGRVLKKDGKITLREYKDCTPEELLVSELNVGCFMFRAEWLWRNIDKIENKNAQKEYYVNDLVNIASANGERVETVEITPHEALGANSREELEILERFA